VRERGVKENDEMGELTSIRFSQTLETLRLLLNIIEAKQRIQYIVY